MMVTAKELLAQLDPFYFLDYALFTGAVRHYASLTLEEAFKEAPNPLHRRLHFINVLKEEYAAYEDAGAMLNAYLDFREGKVDVPISSLMSFKVRDVQLDSVFKSHNVKSSDTLFATLKLNEWVPTKWPEWFPHLDVGKSIRLACRFFFEDCTRNQKEYGVVAYNKIKHGLLVVPSGNQYKPSLPDSPAVLFPTPPKLVESGEGPYTIYGFNTNDEQIENRHRVIELVQCNLRLLAGLYVAWRYPGTLNQRGIGGVREMFESRQFEDIRHLIGEVTAKK